MYQFVRCYCRQLSSYDQLFHLSIHSASFTLLKRFRRARENWGCAWCFRLRPFTQRETVAAVPTSIWFWITFHIGVFIALAVDLASFKRRHRALTMRAATLRSLLWVVLSLGFSLVVAQTQGPDRALDFLTCYLIEYFLSVDNIFVFVLIFSYVIV